MEYIKIDHFNVKSKYIFQKINIELPLRAVLKFQFTVPENVVFDISFRANGPKRFSCD